jgi:hypothetical protein
LFLKKSVIKIKKYKNMMVYVVRLLIICLLWCSFDSPLRAIDEHHTAQTRDFDFDTIAFDDEDGLQFIEYLDYAGMDHMSRAINPADVMAILTSLGVPEILQEPLFLHTNILNKRSLLDQPIFEPDRAEFPGSAVVGSSFFIRKTDRSNFTRDSTQLKSYIALAQASLIAKLENTLERASGLTPDLDVNIAKILSLFENMTVEERQLGCMLHGMKRWRNTTIRLMMPIYYLESNFSLTKREQDRVAEVLGALDPEEEEAFRKAHFISDKIGIGDTRIEIDHTLIKRPSYTLRCGALATLPTAWRWGGGFLGSLFPKPSTLPTFDLEALFEALGNPTIESEQEAQALLSDFLLDSFDRVAADLIDVPLGNNRHFGLGGYIRGKIPLRHYTDIGFMQKMHWASRTSLEFFLPSMEKRFYINTIDTVGFGEHNFNDSDLATQNLQFLKEQAISRLFLRAFDTRIVPGVIFRWNGGLYYKGQQWGYNLGPDFWLQNKAQLSSIQAPFKTISKLDIPIAKQPIAYQGKLFGGIVFRHKMERSLLFISLNGDVSIFGRGLGQDYSLALNIEASF